MTYKILLLLPYSLFGAILTWLIIEKVVKRYIRKKLTKKLKKDKNHLSELPKLVFFSGLIEIILYSGSIFIGKPEFIILWLTFKTALRWDRKKNEENESKDVERRGTFHSFLIGTALNILFGYIAASLANGSIILYFK